jgi:hypothetical protein
MVNKALSTWIPNHVASTIREDSQREQQLVLAAWVALLIIPMCTVTIFLNFERSLWAFILIVFLLCIALWLIPGEIAMDQPGAGAAVAILMMASAFMQLLLDFRYSQLACAAVMVTQFSIVAYWSNGGRLSKYAS